MNWLRHLLGMLTIDHIVADFQLARERLLGLVQHHRDEANAYTDLAAKHKATAAEHAGDADHAQRIATKLGELVS